jgi:hypothetical protein
MLIVVGLFVAAAVIGPVSRLLMPEEPAPVSHTHDEKHGHEHAHDPGHAPAHAPAHGHGRQRPLTPGHDPGHGGHH